MRPVIHFIIGGHRIEVRAGSALSKGLAAAAIRHGWVRGNNLPRTAKAAERAAWAARRAARA